MKRRNFIRLSAFGAASIALPVPVLADTEEDIIKLTILHTNDVHSRIDPFPADHKRYPGMGGAASRAAIIKAHREKEKHLLVFDSGDIFQGTPYFNFFKGELEFKLMSKMGYDAATIGNHDFDAGIDGLYRQLQHAEFTFVNCNYDFRGTIMEGQSMNYKIFRLGRLKIGVTGAGVELNGLVPPALYGQTKYLDPVKEVNQVAHHLKNERGCDYVIVLSHLGYKYKNNKVSDVALAAVSDNIDLILGGHTHTFLEEPVLIQNAAGKMVMINQVGWAGIALGKIEIFFHKKNDKKRVFGQTVIVDKKSIGI